MIDPGPIDTGWMDDGDPLVRDGADAAGRVGTPQDITDLVRFLLSEAVGWITGRRA